MIFETTHHEEKGRILYGVGNKGELSHKPGITTELIHQVWTPSLLPASLLHKLFQTISLSHGQKNLF